MAAGNPYSTLVTWAKIALPTLGLGLLASLFLLSDTTDPEDALPFADIDLEQVFSEQRLSMPRFSSTLEDGRAISMVADSAVQTADQSDRIVLNDVWLDFALAGDERALLRSDIGTVDLGGQQVGLSGDVLAQTDGGYALRSADLIVALGGETLSITAPGAVRITGGGLTLEAGAMELGGAAGAEVAHFTGGVRLIYHPPE